MTSPGCQLAVMRFELAWIAFLYHSRDCCMLSNLVLQVWSISLVREAPARSIDSCGPPSFRPPLSHISCCPQLLRMASHIQRVHFCLTINYQHCLE